MIEIRGNVFIFSILVQDLPHRLQKTNLESHDEVCEVKLCLQVQLDGDILQTCTHNDQ